MPVQYSSILEEHRAVRFDAGMFDASHMGEFIVTGPQAEAFLDYLVTNRVSMDIGRAVYSPMCYPDGGVVDDLIVYRTAAERFLVVVNASNRDKDLAWFRQHAEAFDCEVRDESDAWALVAIQGPKAKEILQPFCTLGLSILKSFWHAPTRVAGVDCVVSHTGYTGERGYEIFCRTDDAEYLVDSLYRAGQPHGLGLCGLGARDSLRLEAGLPLYGHEMSHEIDPLTAGFGWTVKFNKDDFIGKDALEAKRDAGTSHRVVFYIIDNRRIAREGQAVLHNGKEVGRILSGTLSPLLERAIGSALIETEHTSYSELSVDMRGKEYPLMVARPPLHHAYCKM